ncbi:DALR anticodon-binding domain-containing protein [Nostoc sp.]|uniref:DALR anticodon-binding domain-containing protein n=1 Tax=Nostoc sp. TaxID=1180 RepID=UPI002FF71D97
MHHKLPVSNYTSIKQLIYSYLIELLSINTFSSENKRIKGEKIPLHKGRDNSKLFYISGVALRLSKSQNQKAMEFASAIASDISEICGGVFSIQIVPPGWIHFELTDSTLATWLQSVAVGSSGGDEGDEGRIDAPCPMPHTPCPMPNAPCPMPHAQCPMPNSLFAVQYAHARCCSLVLLAHREGLIKLREPVPNSSPAFWSLIAPNPIPWLNSDGTLRLNHPDERRLIAELVEVVDNIKCPDISGSVKWEKVGLNLSQAFEKFWSSCRIWGEVKITSPEVAQARLGLLMATQSVLRYVLEENLGVFAPLEL